jgi:hypothetical protein
LHPRSFLTFLLTAALVLPVPAAQQSAPATEQPAAPSQAAQPAAATAAAAQSAVAAAPAITVAGELKLVVIQGEGAINNVRTKKAVPPVVEVRDGNDKPVAGAEVVFSLPAAGPGGVFNGWMRTQTARSNAQGQAGPNGYVPNEELGRFNIKITANAGGKSTSAIVAQVNSRTAVENAKSGRSKTWKILAIVGGAALVGGVVAVTRNGNSGTSASTNPVTITPGPVVIGGPR